MKNPAKSGPDYQNAPDIGIVLLMHAYWSIVRQRILLVVAFTLAGLLISTIIAFLMKPVYRAEVLLAPQSTGESSSLISRLGGNVPGFASLVGLGVSADAEIESSIATLSSRSIALEFIQEQDLLPVLFSKRWDAEKNDWLSTAERPTDWDGIEIFLREIRSINRDPGTGLVSLRIEWVDPALTADWANALVEKANDLLREAAVKEADKSIEYLKTKLGQVEQLAVKDVLYELLEGQLNQAAIASGRTDYAFRVIDPALEPDPDDYVRPRRAAIITIGTLLGALMGLLAAIIGGAADNASATRKKVQHEDH